MLVTWLEAHMEPIPAVETSRALLTYHGKRASNIGGAPNGQQRLKKAIAHYREPSSGTGGQSRAPDGQRNDGAGAWKKDLDYVLERAHGVETLAWLGVPLVGLTIGMALLGGPTLGMTALLSLIFAGLGPVFRALHDVANPEAANSATVRRLTGWTTALGAALPLAAQSVIGVVIAGAAIAWLTHIHARRNRAWVRRTVAEAMPAGKTDAATAMLRVLLARAHAQGVMIDNVKPAAWRALAQRLRMDDVSDVMVEQMIARFVALYNGTLERGMAEERALTDADLTDGFAFASTTAGQREAPARMAAPVPAVMDEGLGARRRLLDRGS